MKHRLDSIQAVRAIAALMIVFSHFHTVEDKLGLSQLSNQFASWGGFRSDLFFVISGFIMVIVHWNDFGRLQRVPRFLLKRGARIYPIYLMLTIGLFALFRFVPQAVRNWQTKSADLIHSLTLLPSPSGATPLIYVAWTLQHEIFFYLIMAIFMCFPRGIAFRLFFCWGVVAQAIQFFVKIPDGPNHVTYLSALCGNLVVTFLFGVGIAYLYKTDRLKPSVSVGVAGVAAFCVAGYYASTMSDKIVMASQYRDLFAGIPCAAIVYSIIGLEAARRIRFHKWFIALGDASFSIFLLHTIIFAVVGRFTSIVPRGSIVYASLYFTFCIVVTIYLSVLFFRIVELPITAFLNRLIERRTWGAGHRSITQAE